MGLAFIQAEQFEAIFLEALPPEWEPVELGRERAGSWEWLATSWPDLRRPAFWTVLAATPTRAEGGLVERVITEAWAVADWRDRFRRELVASTAIDVGQADDMGRYQPLVAVQVEASIARAEQWRALDLSETIGSPEFMEEAAAESSVRSEPVERLTASDTGERSLIDLVGERPGMSTIDAAAWLRIPHSRLLQLVVAGVERGELQVSTHGRQIQLNPVPRGLSE